jgi:glycosyltransferase involved in cell wall biosynthesis
LTNEQRKIKVLVINSDAGGCYHYRVRIPFVELRRFGIEADVYPYLPHDPGKDDFETFINFVHPYDLVVIQRCFKLGIIWHLRRACDVMGKKIVFETDDDYLHIPLHNPCAIEFEKPRAVSEFLQVLQLADHLTVSTEELKRVYYRYNRNITVLPNNVEGVHFFKDAGEMPTDEEGRYKPVITHGFVHIPAYAKTPDGGSHRIIRLGYTGTETHRRDFETIKGSWFRILKKYAHRVQAVYLGDMYFPKMHEDMLGRQNMFHINNMDYFLYFCNIRNLDIGIAPLEINLFNMGKSPIKALEYGAWGIPAVLPNYITYDRTFEHRKTAMLYTNRDEFEANLTELIENPELRKDIGNNARAMVDTHRTEKINAERRYELYKHLVDTSRPIKMFKGKENAIKQDNDVQTDARLCSGTAA